MNSVANESRTTQPTTLRLNRSSTRALGYVFADGTFDRVTNDGKPGAKPGEYRATVRSVGTAQAQEDKGAITTSPIPSRYHASNTSGLKLIVESETANALNVDL